MVVGGERDSPLFRVSSAVLDENISLALSNAGTNEVLIFEPNGSLKMRFGGTGPGPEEFRLLSQVHWMEGGRLAATGEALRKVVVIDFQDGFVTSHSFHNLKIQSVLPLPRGQWLTHSISAPIPEPGGGRYRVAGSLMVHDSAGHVLREFASVPGFELIDIAYPGGGMVRGFPPFPMGTFVAVDDAGCVFTATDDDATVRAFDLTGRWQEVASLRERVPREVTQDEWNEEIERMVQRDQNSSVHVRLRRMLKTIPFDPRRPAFSGMEVDDAGRIWLTPYHTAGTDIDGWWVVPKRGGEPAWVRAPPGTRRLLEVRFDHAVLLHETPLDVETVTVHPLRNR
jgi:hypothetical protein